MTLKQRFLKAVGSGELGKLTELGVVVTVPEFKAYFSDLNARYSTSFCPLRLSSKGGTGSPIRILFFG